MSDSKISALTSATTPLAGTEVLPIVQSSATVKVATNDLTVRNVRANATTGILQVTGPAAASTRVMTTPDANFTAARTDAAQSFTGDQTLSTGNLIQGTAAKGVNFTANTPTAGKTSQLLNWYEEGTFVATLTPNTSGTITLSSNNTLSYTRMGRVVVVNGLIDVASVSLPVGTYVLITTLPFTPASISPNAGRSGGAFGVLSTTAGNITPGLLINGGVATTYIAMNASTVQTGTSFYVQFTYITA